MNNLDILFQQIRTIRSYGRIACVYGPPILETKAVVDIVFCLDCSCSMDCCMEIVKNHINAFVESLNADQDVIVDWRMRVVGYGDLEEGEEIQNRNDFVSTVSELQKQVACIEMCDGYDEPESTLDAIIAAAKTSEWRKRSQKVIIVFTDATTKDIHYSTRKSFDINTIEELRASLCQDRINLLLCGPADPNYDRLKAVPKAEIIELADPHVEFRNKNKMEELLELMGKTVSHFIGFGNVFWDDD